MSKGYTPKEDVPVVADLPTTAKHTNFTSMPAILPKNKDTDDKAKKLAALKELAERFRATADDRPALVKLVNEAREANKPEDAEIEHLCFRMVNAMRGDAVRGIADEIKDQTE